MILKIRCLGLAAVCLPAATLLAQTPQIGGGICSTATLTGTYSLSFSGRDVSSAVTFSKVSQGTGTAVFDGVGGVTFSLTTNTNAASGLTQGFIGTYSLQANCAGTLSLIINGTANFTLEAYAVGKSFLITGQDSVYAYSGSGSILPAACNASLLSGTFAFNGTGYTLTSGSVSGIGNISGLLQFDGKNAIATTWYLAASTGLTTMVNTTGTYIVTPSCIAKAIVTDSNGNTSSLVFAITSANGSDFILTGSDSSLMFIGRAAQNVTPACSAATLTGTRSLVLNGRGVNAEAALSQSFQSVGMASFDGVSHVTFILAVNTSKSQSQTQTLSGTYSLAPDCVGSVNITTGDTATYTLIVYNGGKNLTLTGPDAVYVFAGSGGTPPATCITSSVSGVYAFSGNGFTLSPAGAVTGVNDISGLLTFDGRGGIAGNWSVASNGKSTADTASGQFALTSSCQGSATIKDSSGSSFSLTLSVTTADNADFGVTIANSQNVFAATGHATFNTPGLTLENGASYVSGGTPAGSDFVLFGTNLSKSAAGAASVPLPKTLLTTSVTVNGEAAPLYFVDPTQINAQMPLDIQPGLATVTVTTAGNMSNSAAVNVPAGAVPGLFFYGINRAVVQNPNYSLNSSTSPAHIGDVLVGYFTGGGTVTPAGPLTTGAASPLGLSPVTAKSVVTVGGQPATVNYIGLAPALVGVYQVNFVVPQVAPGDLSLVINIGGTNSLAELITIGN